MANRMDDSSSTASLTRRDGPLTFKPSVVTVIQWIRNKKQTNQHEKRRVSSLTRLLEKSLARKGSIQNDQHPHCLWQR
jgi:hypothetical protein